MNASGVHYKSFHTFIHFTAAAAAMWKDSSNGKKFFLVRKTRVLGWCKTLAHVAGTIRQLSNPGGTKNKNFSRNLQILEHNLFIIMGKEAEITQP